MSIMSSRNLTMMTDLYQLTMMYGYFKKGMAGNKAVFDLFFRDTKANSSYAVMAGTESIVEYINDLHFSENDVAYLRSLNLFDESFLSVLRGLHFTGEIYAMEEGTLVYPYEPLVRVIAPIMEAQLVETALLNLVNHQTLIATKASRVCYAAKGDAVMEFGLRRAQGPDAGNYGARAAVVGGCCGTSNVLTGQLFNIPILGTHAHSWVMSFPTELDAFRAYADIFPGNCLLLVDTYDTLRSGVPNAITVFNELRSRGYEPAGIRLDSGDLAYLTKKARKMLDEAGFENAKICVSGDLDETLINSLKMQGACINTWGVGTKLITSDDKPALGGVYKMSAEIIDGVVYPKIKLSENAVKITNPGIKTVYRLYDKEDILNRILTEFGLPTDKSHIVNGHVPVEQKNGESPIKCGGKLLVIDGGFSKAYQSKTGIAGYTLVANSHGMRLVSHEPFESAETAIKNESDIFSDSIIVETSASRQRVADTDIGKELRVQIHQLEELLEAYREGIIVEKDI